MYYIVAVAIVYGIIFSFWQIKIKLIDTQIKVVTTQYSPLKFREPEMTRLM